MDKFYAVYLSVIIVGKQTCMIPRDLHHTESMAAYKMIRLKFELSCKSSILHRPWRPQLAASSERLRPTVCNVFFCSHF